MIIIIIKYQNGLLQQSLMPVVATGLYGFQTMDLSKYHTILLYYNRFRYTVYNIHCSSIFQYRLQLKNVYIFLMLTWFVSYYSVSGVTRLVMSCNIQVYLSTSMAFLYILICFNNVTSTCYFHESVISNHSLQYKSYCSRIAVCYQQATISNFFINNSITNLVPVRTVCLNTLLISFEVRTRSLNQNI